MVWAIYSSDIAAKGESTMVETVFENRFPTLEEMRRMGFCVQRLSVARPVLIGQVFAGLKFYQRIFALVLL